MLERIKYKIVDRNINFVRNSFILVKIYTKFLIKNNNNEKILKQNLSKKHTIKNLHYTIGRQPYKQKRKTPISDASTGRTHDPFRRPPPHLT